MPEKTKSYKEKYTKNKLRFQQYQKKYKKMYSKDLNNESYIADKLNLPGNEEEREGDSDDSERKEEESCVCENNDLQDPEF